MSGCAGLFWRVAVPDSARHFVNISFNISQIVWAGQLLAENPDFG